MWFYTGSARVLSLGRHNKMVETARMLDPLKFLDEWIAPKSVGARGSGCRRAQSRAYSKLNTAVAWCWMHKGEHLTGGAYKSGSAPKSACSSIKETPSHSADK